MSGARTPVGRLIETTTRLCEMLAKENSLLAARRPRDLAAYQEEKEALSRAYQDEMETVRDDPAAVSEAAPRDIARLKAALGIFHRLLDDHRRALEAAKSVTERLVKSIADELAGDDRPTHRYDQRAMIAVPRSAYAGRAVSLALDQVI